MKRVVIILLSVLLACASGCATPVTYRHTPAGQVVKDANCHRNVERTREGYCEEREEDQATGNAVATVMTLGLLGFVAYSVSQMSFAPGPNDNP